jgi:hypothetical protein
MISSGILPTWTGYGKTVLTCLNHVQTCMYMFIQVHGFMNMYVHCIYMRTTWLNLQTVLRFVVASPFIGNLMGVRGPTGAGGEGLAWAGPGRGRRLRACGEAGRGRPAAELRRRGRVPQSPWTFRRPAGTPYTGSRLSSAGGFASAVGDRAPRARARRRSACATPSRRRHTDREIDAGGDPAIAAGSARPGPGRAPCARSGSDPGARAGHARSPHGSRRTRVAARGLGAGSGRRPRPRDGPTGSRGPLARDLPTSQGPPGCGPPTPLDGSARPTGPGPARPLPRARRDAVPRLPWMAARDPRTGPAACGPPDSPARGR